MVKLETRDNQFILNGEPIQIISGAIHYFRVVPEYWEDRLLKLKACGFNTVETYVPWNLHEPEEGQFNFEGFANLTRFLTIANNLGLYAIVRPSPYICAEWEFGGLPYWLLEDDNMRLRCTYEPYLEKVRNYFDVLLPMLKPYLSTNGGAIIAMQIENEYGSYGNDTNYLQEMKTIYEQHDIDVLLFTSDGPEDSMLQGGMIQGVLETVNFGSNAERAFNQLKKYQPNGPLMCMEFWNGWFDHWFEEHHERNPKEVANEFETMLQQGASVNFYMFHGGTNFGFYNGANHIENYEPTVTSYDYDAPLNEYGEPTEKYFLIRDVIQTHFGKVPEELPEQMERKAFGSVQLKQRTNLLDSLDKLSERNHSYDIKNMEKMGQDYGFILYETKIAGPRDNGKLFLQDVHDRALVYVDEKYIGTIERWSDNKYIELSIPENGVKLSILVENMGRINYGPLLKDRKGITEGVRFENQFLYDWNIYRLKMDDLSRLDFMDIKPDEASPQSTPAFYQGHITIEEPADTIIHLNGWIKGVVFVNGFNLGRYWEVGPQKSLYLPGPLLKKGENQFIIFEQHGTKNREIWLKKDS
ncbi:beta-galactosidase [Gracilibacillus salitolerans]|uniref:Beta-galactosidase n=1 Tax=Gracilibacillus salitolerans TaxID=2663022 RepID=A0A5Q2TTK8_9BACI|nr:beta-galactosidase family protein [Gracilibacillus salitolerans]QGH36118.1 beta-galactosidase [Gracilibacillus salitolerans]